MNALGPEYSQTFPSIAKWTTPSPTTWSVPVEMAIACSSSRFVPVILQRVARGELPDPSAEVVVDGHQFLAVVTYGGARAVYLPLNIATWRR